jgi:type II secretory ATPase GspE/PulE/Tfp pilus assembly ATPase PilB-like protein
MEGKSLETVREIAKKNGMKSLRDSALDKARQGLTTVEEVLRVTKLDDERSAEEKPPVEAGATVV